ncbi:type II toxin-antitoxin system ParD family antitoxin [Methylobacterium sp. J-077]|uniref:type II toxin-antitoxin system ParD family antitoxin n=1 Tax=Methylobacterium sp. J-077 TaxID=2836656 RepID=UPI001FBB1D12|nr:type II toxin-antitoxin system ParD family antitoxin [Methylobacterium sp. J-077]MCJ2125943.1 type II toxin-antitoxin system ParD family antitoxin [Methylobacterium sp. J-077]
MDVRVEDRWQGFIERVIREGRYGSANDVVREGLRLVAEREAQLQALRETLDASIAAGGQVSEAEIDAALDAADRALEARGFGE